MALARNKIVKVENVGPGGVHFGENTILGNENKGEKYLSLQSAPGYLEGEEKELTEFRSTPGKESSIDDDDDIPSEAADVVYPLPLGWPKIPQLLERKSWNFSTAVSPSVNKAVGHLELLQNIIEEWFKEAESAIASRSSSRKSLANVETAGNKASRKQLKFNEPHGRASSGLSGVSVKHHDLSVQGIGARADKFSSKYQSSLEYEIPHLGADEVIEEVITLLAKLEDDRQETLKGLAQERDRVGTLGAKIDTLAAQRMTDLPIAVQKEHEACAMDISELNWHVSYRGRNEGNLGTRVSAAEALNDKLKDDVAFVHGHVPLVAEKLDLEQVAMERIQHAQNETDDELSVTVDRCKKVENKSQDAHAKADQERKAMKKDLDGVRNDLQRISQELSEAKIQHTSYVTQCESCRQKLIDNEQELKVLQVKEENTKVAEAMQASKLKELQAEIVQAEYEHRRLDDYNHKVFTEKETKWAHNTQLEEDLEAEIAHKSEVLRHLLRQNQELDMDIEDNTKKKKVPTATLR